MRLDWGLHEVRPLGERGKADARNAITFDVDFLADGRPEAVRCRPEGADEGRIVEELNCVVQPMMLLLRKFSTTAHPSPTVLPMRRAFLALGGLRAALMDFEDYNSTFEVDDDGGGAASVSTMATAYVRSRAGRLLSDLGLPVGQPVNVTDLQLLINVVQEAYADVIGRAEKEVSDGLVSFGSLFELYTPRAKVVDHVSSFHEELGMSIVAVWFEEQETLYGLERSFHVELEFAACVGKRFAVLTCRRNIPSFEEPREVTELPLVPMAHVLGISARLASRGDRFVTVAGGSLLSAYDAGTFRAESGHAANASAVTGNGELALVRSGGTSAGRCIVDFEAAMADDASVAPGVDAPSEAVREATSRLARLEKAGRLGQGSTSAHCRVAAGISLVDGLLVLEEVPTALRWCLYPCLPAFSLDHRCFGHVKIVGLRNVHWSNSAWDSLVLPYGQKDVLRAVLLHPREGGAAQLTRHHGQGTIFMLRGPAGTGKSFTVEAIAQFLQRPVYTLSACDLGRNHEAASKTLANALQLCSRWGCILTVDNADCLFDTADVGGDRRSLVHSIIYQLEKHSDVVFMTTTLACAVDAEVQSHLTLTVTYSELGASTRMAVWHKVLLGVDGVKEDDIGSQFDVAALARAPLDGWQIRNVLRIAIALAREQGEPLKQSFLVHALTATCQSPVLEEKHSGSSAAVSKLGSAVPVPTEDLAAAQVDVGPLCVSGKDTFVDPNSAGEVAVFAPVERPSATAVDQPQPGLIAEPRPCVGEGVTPPVTVENSVAVPPASNGTSVLTVPGDDVVEQREASAKATNVPPRVLSSSQEATPKVRPTSVTSDLSVTAATVLAGSSVTTTLGDLHADASADAPRTPLRAPAPAVQPIRRPVETSPALVRTLGDQSPGVPRLIPRDRLAADCADSGSAKACPSGVFSTPFKDSAAATPNPLCSSPAASPQTVTRPGPGIPPMPGPVPRPVAGTFPVPAGTPNGFPSPGSARFGFSNQATGKPPSAPFVPAPQQWSPKFQTRGPAQQMPEQQQVSYAANTGSFSLAAHTALGAKAGACTSSTFPHTMVHQGGALPFMQVGHVVGKGVTAAPMHLNISPAPRHRQQYIVPQPGNVPYAMAPVGNASRTASPAPFIRAQSVISGQGVPAQAHTFQAGSAREVSRHPAASWSSGALQGVSTPAGSVSSLLPSGGSFAEARPLASKSAMPLMAPSPSPASAPSQVEPGPVVAAPPEKVASPSVEPPAAQEAEGESQTFGSKPETPRPPAPVMERCRPTSRSNTRRG
eukprot:TRINITY_DN23979_c0_g1_i1.p1 TRINITY_DN23979_c0_g1~~TRINITY_DN23979_c0_g1_i1.p1  ORF type:complete len:1276 (+),score=187.07 TRINITY_DN23979_c0_g1_i1:65-3892(+)